MSEKSKLPRRSYSDEFKQVSVQELVLGTAIVSIVAILQNTENEY
tara:strand:+ start:97427 stop:97561 length:135 start_codon:yes stop_codon:yes gene_type:complete